MQISSKKQKQEAYILLLLVSFFLEKNQKAKGGSWWQTDLFNQIYSIGINSHICPVNYADDLNFVKTLWLLESRAELIKNFENRKRQ